MSVPSTFKGAVVNEPNARMAIVDRTLSPLEPGEIAIKVTATAMNPVDWKMRETGNFINEYPAVLGGDAAGVVVDVGAEVKDFKAGDRVFWEAVIGNSEMSAFQEYCKMPAELVAKTPSNITDEEASSFMIALMGVVTGFYAPEGHGLTPPWLEGGRTVGKGKSVAIIGGASSVGQFAIQMARLSGFSRIVTNASTAHHAYLKSLGADVVLDRHTSSPESFAEAVGEVPLDFVIDTISETPTQIQGVQILQAAGVVDSQLITMFTLDGGPDPEAVALGDNKEPKVEVRQVVGVASLPNLRWLTEPLMKFLGGEDGYIARRLVKPNRLRIISGGLPALEEALDVNKKGVSGVKVVLRMIE